MVQSRPYSRYSGQWTVAILIHGRVADPRSMYFAALADLNRDSSIHSFHKPKSIIVGTIQHLTPAAAALGRDRCGKFFSITQYVENQRLRSPSFVRHSEFRSFLPASHDGSRIEKLFARRTLIVPRYNNAGRTGQDEDFFARVARWVQN